MSRTVKNILFIMCDQLRSDYLSCAGHPHLHTPNIDALAARGVRFSRAYAQSPICGASRMCFYTGRYVHSHGASWNDVPLKFGEMTMGDYLRPLGLRTVLVGKTHMRADTEGMARLGIDPASEIGVLVSECGFEPFERDDGLYGIGPDGRYNEREPRYNDYLRKLGFDGDNPWHDWANAAADDDGDLLSGWFLKNAGKPARIPDEHSETPYMTRRGSVSPTEFIPVAEEIGMIGRLGEWALKKACADAMQWPDDISLAVNVSPIQFTRDDFVTTLSDALAETGLAPHRIELEITESLFLAEDDATLQAMTALKAAGIRIALDDFGTGYSALSYIHKFPIDKIKIDRSFVLGLENDRTQNLEIVRAIVAMADSLGIETLAEGVENVGQLALVTAAGCRQIQGFHFARSVSAQEILAMTAGDCTLPGGPASPEAERHKALRVVAG